MLASAGRRQRSYARFLEAASALTLASAELAPALSRRGRITLCEAVLRLGEADRSLALALTSPDRRRLAEAAHGLDGARTALVDAGREAAFDAARRRSLSLARTPVR
jgi:hypothetical protein